MLLFRLPARFLLRAPGRWFSALLFQEPPCSTRRPVGRSGPRDRPAARREPPVPEGRAARPPRVGMRRVRHPGANSLLHLPARDRPGPPAVAQPAQPVAEAAHALLRQPPAAAGAQLEAEERRRRRRGRHVRLGRVQRQAPAREERRRALAPGREPSPVVGEQREVVGTAPPRSAGASDRAPRTRRSRPAATCPPATRARDAGPRAPGSSGTPPGPACAASPLPPATPRRTARRTPRPGRTGRQPWAASCALRQPPTSRPVASSERAACS